ACSSAASRARRAINWNRLARKMASSALVSDRSNSTKGCPTLTRSPSLTRTTLTGPVSRACTALRFPSAVTRPGASAALEIFIELAQAPMDTRKAIKARQPPPIKRPGESRLGFAMGCLDHRYLGIGIVCGPGPPDDHRPPKL